MQQIEKHIPNNVSIIDSFGAGMFFSLFSIMWQQKSNEAVNVMDNTSKELNKYFTNFTEIQNTINLLSVNASIEARRAGNAGAGFAAIARAIKDLVVQSEKTTKECHEELKKMEKVKSNMLNKDSNFLELNS